MKLTLSALLFVAFTGTAIAAPDYDPSAGKNIAQKREAYVGCLVTAVEQTIAQTKQFKYSRSAVVRACSKPRDTYYQAIMAVADVDVVRKRHATANTTLRKVDGIVFTEIDRIVSASARKVRK